MRWTAARATLLAAWAGWAVALGVAAATPAAAQTTGAPAAHGAMGTDVPDVPAGPAAIRGRIVHAGRPDAAAGLPVVLYALPAHGTPGLRGTETDARGEFAFEGIAGDPDTSYLVGVRYREIPFGERVTFAPGELERSLELEVRDPTADASGVEVGEVQIRVEPSCQDLQIGQSLELRQPGPAVVYVPEAERQSRPPLVEVVLPENSLGFEVPFGGLSQGLERDGNRVRFWGPLYPGSQHVEFAYGLPASDGRAVATQGFPSGAERVLVLSHEDAPAPTGEALHPAEPMEVAGSRYRVQSAGALEPGSTLTLAVDAPPVAAGSDALSLSQARMWLELDDAALTVDERYELQVSGDQPLEARGAPLLCIPLPADADELRFATSTMSMGLVRDPSGSLAVRGPLPPGESAVSLRYLLPAQHGHVLFERRFAQDLPLLTMFVADTGLVAKSGRLHRRRPFQTEDRNYMHLEAFQVEAGTPVDLDLTGSRAPAAPSRAASALIVGVLSLGALLFLGAPLRSRPGEEQRSDVVSEATHEREAVYAALRDLEHDHETGKLDDEEYERSRQELRSRAVALLRREREQASGAASPATAPAPEPACPECGASTPDDARFCPQCGVRLTSEGGSVRSQGAA